MISRGCLQLWPSCDSVIYICSRLDGAVLIIFQYIPKTTVHQLKVIALPGRYKTATGNGTCMQTPCCLNGYGHYGCLSHGPKQTAASVVICQQCWARRSSWLYKAIQIISHVRPVSLLKKPHLEPDGEADQCGQRPRGGGTSVTSEIYSAGVAFQFFDVIKFPSAVTTMIPNNANVYQIIPSHPILNYFILPSWLWHQVKGLLKLQCRREERKPVDVFYSSKPEN